MASLQQQLSDVQLTTSASLQGLRQQLEGLEEQHRQPPLGLLSGYTQQVRGCCRGRRCQLPLALLMPPPAAAAAFVWMQVSELFEQLAVGLLQDMHTSIARLDDQQQQVRRQCAA